MLGRDLPDNAAVTPAARAFLKGQEPLVLWFTGLSAAGKTTVGTLLEARLHADGRHTYMLDGDALRTGLSRDLGFSDADRRENIRRAGEIARLMADAGLIVIATFISPFREDRATVRRMFAPGRFVEIYLEVPLAVAEARDPKGLYRRARSGALPRFTGIDSPYEPPEGPEIRIRTDQASPEEAVSVILAALAD
jgi:adenylyl-sulfate kinase